jgi:hypothetical protein
MAVAILMELGACEPVPAFKAPAIPHQLQQRFWHGAQAGQGEVPLQGGLPGRLPLTTHSTSQLLPDRPR